jgi:hypothetical protein
MPEHDRAEGSSGAPEVHEHHRSLGPAIGVIILVLAIALGVLYFFGSNLVTPPLAPPAQGPDEAPGTPDVDPVAASLSAQSTSTELSAIEEDLAATNLEEIDAELDAMEAELDAALSDVERELERDTSVEEEGEPEAR